MVMPGGWELVLVVLVIMVLFGYRGLPKAARSLGESVRILKTEVASTESDDRERAHVA